MCKKLLLLLFWAIALSLGSAAQETLTVYDGTGTSSNVPIYGLYTDDSYLKCEYVIPAEDLADMAGGTITQLTWYLKAALPSGGWEGANFQIFLKEVDNATLEAYSGLDGATIVYEGAIDGDGTAELTIEFATPYAYGGGNLLVGVYNTVKGTKYKAALFYGQTVTGASGQGKDGSSLDAVTFTQCDFIPKTTFTYTPSGPYYSKPKNLAVSGITTESANLTWEAGSTETAWNVGYKKQADEQWTEFSVSTTSATLTDLDRATIYDVRVQADYGAGNLSYWTTTSFATLVCDDADKGQISYELTDSYDDGWSGNAVNIVHHDTGIVMATLTIASGGSATGTVDLCYGETYDIVWVKGSYPAECSFVISDENGVIYEYAKTSTGPTAGVLHSFTWRRTTCKKPTALTAGGVAYNAATLTWTPGDEDQDNWQVAYGTGDDFDPDAEGVTLLTANINPTLTLSNLAENTTYHAYVRSNCGEGDVSAWSDVCTFTTPEQFPTPTALTVTDITTESAKLTWEAGSTETAWNVGYKKQADEQWTEFSVSTTSATLTDLDRATNYDVRVQADYGAGNLTGWITTSFTTLICDDADKGQISYELTDSYGDGWSNNAVNIVHHDTGIVIATLTVSSGSSASGTVDLCYGETYDIVWVSGGTYSYPDECSFVISDENGVIYEYAKTSTGPTAGVLHSFTWRRTTCKKPTALTAGGVAYNAATLTWTPGDEDQDNWQVAYGTGDDFDPDAEGVTLLTANINPTLTLSNLAENTTYHAYVRSNCGEGDVSAWSDVCTFTTPEQFPTPTALTVTDIKAHGATATWTGEAQSYTLRYRSVAGYEASFFESFENGQGDWTLVNSDGDNYNWMFVNCYDLIESEAKDGEQVAFTLSYYNNSALTPDEWLISPKVDLKGMLRYWMRDDGYYPETYRIYVSTTGTELADFEPLTGDLQSPLSSAWTERSHDLSQFEGQQGYIAFRHYNCTNQDYMFLDAVGISEPVGAGEWTVVENTTSPCNLTGLSPLTAYEVQVQANYDGATSQWTGIVPFVTADGSSMPTGLTVSDVKANSAKAQWTGVQDAYNLRYRSKAYTFFEDFEAGIPETWGNIDADGDTYNWYQFAPTNGTVDNVGNPTVLDTACATSASYVGNSALTPDNWLVTPLVDLGGTLSVWLRGQDPSYAAEHFAIYVSTTGNTAEDFTTELVPETVATGVYVEYTADLSEYAGQQGYIAIRHFNCTDQFRLNVDNFGVYGEVGEWVTVQNVTSPYTITGLNGSTYYEVEVQGIVGDQTTEWTDAVVFKTAQGLRGDINGDGQVDVLDVNIAINITLNKDSAANYPGNADVNEDTIMDVADVNAIINIMLGKN